MSGHSVTFISRAVPGLPVSEIEDGFRHTRVPGFDHTRHLAVNLVLDFVWGIRVARALPAGDVVICNTITLPAWLHRIRPTAGKVAVMIGRTPKGQVRFYGGVERIYAPSTFLARQISSNPASKRTKVIGYPIDWHLHARNSAQLGSPITIGFVGRLHPEKGIALLLGAAFILATRTNIPEWKLKIVGPESVSEGGGGDVWLVGLKNDAARLLGDRVEWTGPEFDPEPLARHFGTMDIFCYPSLAEKGETFGVSVAEAMASRCAVVVSALECFGDLVIDGQTGSVFDHRAKEPEVLLANALARLLADSTLRKDVAIRGQEHSRRFDYPDVSEKILSDLALLTGTRSQKPQ
jgi:glycosyltransferase involved in cell wall biosynthesis